MNPSKYNTREVISQFLAKLDPKGNSMKIEIKAIELTERIFQISFGDFNQTTVKDVVKEFLIEFTDELHLERINHESK